MFASLLLSGLLVAGQPGEASGDAAAAVRHWVGQLDAPILAKREEAERKLLDMGPSILPRLPPIGPDTSAESRQRMERIRQRLQSQAAESALAASRVTLHAEAMPLGDVLAAIQRQTGNRIRDDRQQFAPASGNTNPKLRVDFQQASFWPALDQILDQAGLAVYPYGAAGAVSVVSRSDPSQSRAARASYAGPFRFEPILALAQRDLRQPENQSLKVTIEIAWEPRLSPISIKQPLANVDAMDEQGSPIKPGNPEAEIELPLRPGIAAAQLTLPLALPSRQVRQITRLRGTMRIVTPGPAETFRFDNLPAAREVSQRIGRATVTLEEVRRSGDRWEVRVRARFDEAADALESHRGWIFQNPAFLETASGKPIPFVEMETTRQTPNEVGLAYYFRLDAPPKTERFVYKTPVVIVVDQVRYEIKNVPLP